MHEIIYSVKQFNELVNAVLTSEIGEVTVIGEVSSYQIRQNKWVSFDLKDSESCINCFTSVYQLDFPLADGQEVVVTGTPRIYVPYGKFSFNVATVELKGEGALMKAFEDLKAKLNEEGLFLPVHKRQLPRFPESIGIITSAEGAAVNDILKVINGRWGGLSIHLAPVLVQGRNAPSELVGAIHHFNQYHPVDVIIFGRGGGSLEDLQAFNSERVARAIFSSKIPIITGIGHEHNTSIADLVADIRAATPSNAAELAVPDRQTVLHEITLLKSKAGYGLRQKTQASHNQLWNQAHFLQLAVSRKLHNIRSLIRQLHQTFSYKQELIGQSTQILIRNKLLIIRSAVQIQEKSSTRLAEGKKLLLALSPKAILKRGYSITLDSRNNKPITSLAGVPANGKIKTQVSDGEFESEIRTQPIQKQPVTIRFQEGKPKLESIEQSTLF